MCLVKKHQNCTCSLYNFASFSQRAGKSAKGGFSAFVHVHFRRAAATCAVAHGHEPSGNDGLCRYYDACGQVVLESPLHVPTESVTPPRWRAAAVIDVSLADRGVHAADTGTFETEPKAHQLSAGQELQEQLDLQVRLQCGGAALAPADAPADQV